MKISKPETLLLCGVLSLGLTGCGLADGVYKLCRGFLLGSVILSQLIFIFYGAMKLADATIRSHHGTNAVTKTYRNSALKLVIKGLTRKGALVTVWTIVAAIACKNYLLLLLCIPSIAITVIALYILATDTNTSEDVHSARVTTKASLDVAAGTAEAVGTVAGVMAGNPILGTAIGGAVGNIAEQASDNMTEEGATNIDRASLKEDVNKVAAVLTVDQQLLMDRAKAVGINTDQLTPEQVAGQIIAYAPKARLEERPENMSDIDFAASLLAGDVYA